MIIIIIIIIVIVWEPYDFKTFGFGLEYTKI